MERFFARCSLVGIVLGGATWVVYITGLVYLEDPPRWFLYPLPPAAFLLVVGTTGCFLCAMRGH